MYRYIEIDEKGIPFAELTTPKKFVKETMISVSVDFDSANKKYENGEWVDYQPDAAETPLTAEEKQDARDSYMMLMMEN